MKLTYIYVKKSPLGLLYLGKTIKNPYTYKGSGTEWIKHLKDNKINKQDIETFILDVTDDREYFKFIGRYYSNLFDVVKNRNWANIIPETGGGLGAKTGDNHPMKRPEVKAKITGDKNHMKKPEYSGENHHMKRPELSGENHHMKRPEVKQKIKDSYTEEKRALYRNMFSSENNITSKKVDCYDKNGNFIRTWPSVKKAHEELKVHNITDVCKGKRKYAGGYIWKYAD